MKNTKRDIYEHRTLDPRQQSATARDAKETGGETVRHFGPWPQSRGHARFGNNPGKPWWSK